MLLRWHLSTSLFSLFFWMNSFILALLLTNIRLLSLMYHLHYFVILRNGALHWTLHYFRGLPLGSTGEQDLSAHPPYTLHPQVIHFHNIIYFVSYKWFLKDLWARLEKSQAFIPDWFSGIFLFLLNYLNSPSLKVHLIRRSSSPPEISQKSSLLLSISTTVTSLQRSLARLLGLWTFL